MKKCEKCGMENADQSVFCQSCGATLPAAAPQQPDAPIVTSDTAAPVSYDTPSYAAPIAPATFTAEKNTATLWLILNIVGTVICCPAWIITGIGIVFAALGMGSYKKGDYADMKKKVKISMILFIVGIVIGLVLWIVGFAAGIFQAISNSGY